VYAPVVPIKNRRNEPVEDFHWRATFRIDGNPAFVCQGSGSRLESAKPTSAWRSQLMARPMLGHP
jgi:hypothetical protein